MKIAGINPLHSVSPKKSPLAPSKAAADKARNTHFPPVERLDALFSTLRSSKISMSACHAIIKLYLAAGTKKDGLILSTLASEIGITTAAITSVADSMEKHGFAARRQDPADRRIVLIALTPKGISFAETFGKVAPS